MINSLMISSQMISVNSFTYYFMFYTYNIVGEFFMCISMSDFMKLSNVNVIDLRSNEKFNNSHIPGSINISSDKLLLNPYNYIDKDTKYYLYCQHGMTSRNVCNILSKLGFNVVNVDGGFEEWLLSNR